jgi:hypothetical protein
LGESLLIIGKLFGATNTGLTHLSASSLQSAWSYRSVCGERVKPSVSMSVAIWEKPAENKVVVKSAVAAGRVRGDNPDAGC